MALCRAQAGKVWDAAVDMEHGAARAQRKAVSKASIEATRQAAASVP